MERSKTHPVIGITVGLLLAATSTVSAQVSRPYVPLQTEPPSLNQPAPTAPYNGRVRSLLRPLAIPASGLAAQRLRVDIIAQNIANAQTTRTAEGGPYQRRVVELGRRVEEPSEQFGEYLDARLLSVAAEGHYPRGLRIEDLIPRSAGVEILGVVEDPTEGPMVYDPGHPDANEDGYVQMPNVDVTAEMVDLMLARRMYEANATVFDAAKTILRTSIDRF